MLSTSLAARAKLSLHGLTFSYIIIDQNILIEDLIKWAGLIVYRYHGTLALI